MHLQIEPVGEKQIRIRGIDLIVLDCLHSLPGIFEQRDAPAARRRLLPDPTVADTKTNAEWQRLMTPELRHLFVSAGETVMRDLTAATPAGDLTFPAEHLNAWMSALNQARLILGEIFQITDADMDAAEFDPGEPKGHAILCIHVLGYLLQLLVEFATGHESPTSV